ncbi:MAG: glycosyltransferase [Flavobacteriaceae bacterium]|nr:glycosyltransferase [Flavobacteriaceae bacterium]
MNTQKTILVAPLHWGLGHATRCIPIIKALLKHNFKVLLGSDGAALELLRKEFPELPFVELPSYNISYPKKGEYFKIKMFFKLPEIKVTIKEEQKIIKELVKNKTIDGIISDNRMGLRSKKVPSVFITHQVNVLSGNTSYFSSKIHQKIIKKFDACWVPDVDGEVNLSGKLGHPKNIDFPITYIGPLSRMSPKQLPKKYDVLLLLSGPEPQRSLLEDKLTEEFLKSDYKTLMVRGVVEDHISAYEKENLTIVNFMQTSDLEKAINESALVVSRPGYTTIMDLAAMDKNAFFIPTPGQYEQKYLAKELKNKGMVASCKQVNFTLDQLEKVKLFKGLKNIDFTRDYVQLFRLFEGE